jgi:hypothetical protein
MKKFIFRVPNSTSLVEESFKQAFARAFLKLQADVAPEGDVE